MQVPFLDLKRQTAPLLIELEARARQVLESGRYILGAEVAAFEREFAQYCSASSAIATNSGTSALHLALLAAGVGPGTEVITVPFTFVATVAAILYTGAKPVFVDIDPSTYTMDVKRLAASVTDKTRAIVPVHLYGQPADMDPILDLARASGITVIEDACQAHGARYKTRRVGGVGHLGCFSFYPSKNLGACGEGGMVVTSNPEFERKIRMLRDWGQEGKHCHILQGFNYRMEEMQAALLRVKLPHLDSWNGSRALVAGLYDERLSEAGLQGPQRTKYGQNVYHVYPIKVADREAVRSHLLAGGVETGVHYPVPVHLMPAYAELGYPWGTFPVAEGMAREELSLPLYPGMSVDEVDHVAALLRSAPLRSISQRS